MKKKELNFVTKNHNLTKRNYLNRMINSKVKCMIEAKKYSKNYWDGPRKYGYGGYKYIPGRWAPVAKKLIKNYRLKKGSKILDVGCGKGFLLYEMLKITPGLKIYGCDVSSYALKRNFKLENLKVFKLDIKNKIPFKSKNFDLVISINTLHNLKIFDLENAIKEINCSDDYQYEPFKLFIIGPDYRNSFPKLKLFINSSTTGCFLFND